LNKKFDQLSTLQSIEELMALEGQIKQVYYDTFNTIIDNEDFTFEKEANDHQRLYKHINKFCKFYDL